MINYANKTDREIDLLVEAKYKPMSDLTLCQQYCNSWADMGPIIQRKGIIVDGNGMAWTVVEDETYAHFTNCVGNPLRAAAIVYLKMGE